MKFPTFERLVTLFLAFTFNTHVLFVLQMCVFRFEILFISDIFFNAKMCVLEIISFVSLNPTGNFYPQEYGQLINFRISINKSLTTTRDTKAVITCFSFILWLQNGNWNNSFILNWYLSTLSCLTSSLKSFFILIFKCCANPSFVYIICLCFILNWSLSTLSLFIIYFYGFVCIWTPSLLLIDCLFFIGLNWSFGPLT